MYQEWHKRLEYNKMQHYFDREFWDLVHEEYGVMDELDILGESVLEIITPMPGVIVLITKEFNNGQES